MRAPIIVMLMMISSFSFGQTAKKELPMVEVEVEYRLPVDQLNLPNTSEKWNTGAPMIGEFSNPNRISYDEGHIITFLKSQEIKCGHGNYTVVRDDGREFDFGSGIIDLGHRFKEQDLVKFVQSRLESETKLKKFKVQFRAYVSPNEKFRIPKHSPWAINVMEAITLLGESYSESVSDDLVKLATEDEDEWVRNAAFIALGRLSTVKPSIRKELNRIAAEDSQYSVNVREAYRIAGNVGPSASNLAVHYSRSSRSGKAYNREQLSRSSLELLQRVHYSSCAKDFYQDLDSKEDRIRDAMIWGLTQVKMDGSILIRVPTVDKLELLQEKFKTGEIQPSSNFQRQEIESILSKAIDRLSGKSDE